jgi:hypothetical protein
MPIPFIPIPIHHLPIIPLGPHLNISITSIALPRYSTLEFFRLAVLVVLKPQLLRSDHLLATCNTTTLITTLRQ